MQSSVLNNTGSFVALGVRSALVLSSALLLSGCVARYAAPDPAGGRTANIEFVFMTKSVTSSVVVELGTCSEQRQLGVLSSGQLLSPDRPVIATAVETPGPVAYSLTFAGPKWGGECTELQGLAPEPAARYRVEVGDESSFCVSRVLQWKEDAWQPAPASALVECGQ